jgi:hypothetical protein
MTIVAMWLFRGRLSLASFRSLNWGVLSSLDGAWLAFDFFLFALQWTFVCYIAFAS